MHVLHPKFASDEITIGINQTRLTQANGLDFRTRQYNTGGIGIYELVIERSSFVLYIDWSRFHQFKIRDNLSKTLAIRLGQSIMMTEAHKVYRVRFFSSTFINDRAPSYTTNTV